MPMMSATRKTPQSEAISVSTFRNLYTRVLLGLQAQEHQVLGVTSAIEGEGKTTIAAGLATALSEDGALLGFGRNADTTLLVSCNSGSRPQDPRLEIPSGPGLPGLLGLPGLIELLRGECTLDGAVHKTAVKRLSVLPVGEPVHNFPLAIRTAALAGIMDQLRSQFGLIVLDLPSVLNSTDTQVLARLADQLLIVVRAGVTPSKLVQQALDQLDEEHLLGVVLNDSRSDLPSWLENRL